MSDGKQPLILPEKALPVTRHDYPPDALEILAGLPEPQARFWELWSGGADVLAAMRVAFPHRGKSSNKTLRRDGERLLQSRPFQLLKAARAKVLEERYAVTEERITEALASIAFTDPRAFIKEDGTLKGLAELPPEAAMCVSEISISEAGTVKLKLLNRKQALDSLAKLKGLFLTRHVRTNVNYVVRGPEPQTREEWEAEAQKQLTIESTATREGVMEPAAFPEDLGTPPA